MRWRWKTLVGLACAVVLPAQAACYNFVGGRYIERPCEPVRSNELNRYLSPRCATLNDGMRSAMDQRNYNRAAELRNELVRQCGEELNDTLRQASRERDEARQAREDRWAKAEQTQAQQRAQAEQCAGMRDVIQSRRKREATLNENEVAALRQFEASYNERCLR